ncbi:predicted protein [Plenodomus lingam JN3]|uniref:Predicted protein n=1 Tax=Leptosphaeria maculans (strain JN3 / isolate v23.1.3 / race Av1-4-5-6-7-8) TaxID=985895 RepID=E4ZY48_LEPMJ|nr:predicted protein [Plenodomus lingam JN3]CBX96293.1 predicted protein [Plenodomus lingam JN3]
MIASLVLQLAIAQPPLLSFTDSCSQLLTIPAFEVHLWAPPSPNPTATAPSTTTTSPAAKVCLIGLWWQSLIASHIMFCRMSRLGVAPILGAPYTLDARFTRSIWPRHEGSWNGHTILIAKFCSWLMIRHRRHNLTHTSDHPGQVPPGVTSVSRTEVSQPGAVTQYCRDKGLMLWCPRSGGKTESAPPRGAAWSTSLKLHKIRPTQIVPSFHQVFGVTDLSRRRFQILTTCLIPSKLRDPAGTQSDTVTAVDAAGEDAERHTRLLDEHAV